MLLEGDEAGGTLGAGEARLPPPEGLLRPIAAGWAAAGLAGGSSRSDAEGLPGAEGGASDESRLGRGLVGDRPTLRSFCRRFWNQTWICLRETLAQTESWVRDSLSG